MNCTNLKYQLENIWVWFKVIGAPSLGLVLACLLLGVLFYSVTIAEPIVKLSMALLGFLIVNIVPLYVRINAEDKKRRSYLVGCLYFLLAIFTAYNHFLCLFIVPWPINIPIVAHFVFSLLSTIYEELKKTALPKNVILVRNCLTILDAISLGGYLAYLLFI